MTDIVTRTLTRDIERTLDDAEKKPVKGWRNLNYTPSGAMWGNRFHPSKEAAEKATERMLLAADSCGFWSCGGTRPISEYLFSIPLPIT